MIVRRRNAVICKRMADEVTGEERWRLMDVIGDEPDLGVENLRGSGMIAGETSIVSAVLVLRCVLQRVSDCVHGTSNSVA
jgi:acetyl-CoA carboxylase carboxyltransferase component